MKTLLWIAMSVWIGRSIVPGQVDDKATQLHAIASLKVLLDATRPQNGKASTSAASHVMLSSRGGGEHETPMMEQPNGFLAVSALTEQAPDAVSLLFRPWIIISVYGPWHCEVNSGPIHPWRFQGEY